MSDSRPLEWGRKRDSDPRSPAGYRLRPQLHRRVPVNASPLKLENVLTCPACGDSARITIFDELTDTLFGTVGTWTLKRCQGCFAAYLDPRLTETGIGEAYRHYYTHEGQAVQADPGGATPEFPSAKTKLKNGYLAWRYGYSLAPAWRVAGPCVPIFFPRHRVAFDTTVRHLRLPRPGARLLDVGCGGGEFLVTARSLGWDVTGLEVDPVAAAKCRDRGFEVISVPLAEAGLPDSSYDAITLNHVLEHLHDPRRALDLVLKALRPGGTVWIATPNLDSPLRRALGRTWRGLEPPRHLVLFCKRALRTIVRGVGFRDIHWRTAYPLTRWMYEASRAGQASGSAPAIGSLELKLFSLGTFASQHCSEQLVLTARRPAEARA